MDSFVDRIPFIPDKRNCIDIFDVNMIFTSWILHFVWERIFGWWIYHIVNFVWNMLLIGRPNWRQSQPLQVINEICLFWKKLRMSQTVFDVSRPPLLRKRLIWEISWPSLIFVILRPFMEMSEDHFTRETLRKPKISWKRYKILVHSMEKK